MSNLPRLINANCVILPWEEYTPHTYIHGILFNGMLNRDRFDFLSRYSKLNWDPANAYNGFIQFNQSTKLEDLINDRLQLIINKAQVEHKKIILLWSGGIDSTFLLCLFFSNLPKDIDLELFCTAQAFKDCHPDILDFIRKNNITLKVVDGVNVIYGVEKEKDYICVSGHCSDQTFMFGGIFDYPELFSIPWQDAIAKYVRPTALDFLNKHKFSKDIISSYLRSLPVPVDNFAQFCLFWINQVKTNGVAYANKLVAKTDYFRENEIPFFYDNRILDWGLWNNLPKCSKVDMGRDIREYKTELKNYVVKVTGIESFMYMKKTKSHWYDTTRDIFTLYDTDGFKDFGFLPNAHKYNALLKMYAK